MNYRTNGFLVISLLQILQNLLKEIAVILVIVYIENLTFSVQSILPIVKIIDSLKITKHYVMHLDQMKTIRKADEEQLKMGLETLEVYKNVQFRNFVIFDFSRYNRSKRFSHWILNLCNVFCFCFEQTLKFCTVFLRNIRTCWFMFGLRFEGLFEALQLLDFLVYR